MSNSDIKIYENKLTSSFDLLSTDTSYTDTGLEITLTTGASEWVDIEARGQIANDSSDNFSILIAIDIDGTIEREWYVSDGGNTLHRKPFTIFKRLQLSSGSHTIKIRADNNQGTDVNFSATGSQACKLTAKHYTN